ncbi:MAG: DUF1622 domain-containing protein [Anaerolineaceae bacterium]
MSYHESKDKPLALVNHYLLPIMLIIAILVALAIVSAHPEVGEPRELVGENLLFEIIGYGVLVCELAAMLVILIGVIQALFSFFRHLFERSINEQITTSQTIRFRIGYRLSLALEFAVAADILRLAISPRVSDLLILFVIILLRVLMNFFLEHDSATIREHDIIPELRKQD